MKKVNKTDLVNKVKDTSIKNRLFSAALSAGSLGLAYLLADVSGDQYVEATAYVSEMSSSIETYIIAASKFIPPLASIGLATVAGTVGLLESGYVVSGDDTYSVFSSEKKTKK